MKEIFKSKIYIYAFVFLLIFNFSDVIIYSSSSMKLNIVTLVMFLLPVIYAVYHVNNDEEKLPTHICFFGIVVATVYLMSELFNEIVYFILFKLGEQNINVLFDYKVIIFFTIFILVILVNKIKLHEKIVVYSLYTIFAVTYVFIIFVIGYMFANPNATIIVGEFGMKYLMECFLPLLFLPFIKFKTNEYKPSLILAGVTYCILVIITVYASDTIYNSVANSDFIQQYFINFLYSNFHVNLAFALLLLNSLNSLFFGAVVFIIVRDYAIRNKKIKSTHTDLISIITALVVAVYSLIVSSNSLTLIEVMHDDLIIVQVALLFVILSFSFYLGVKKYMRSGLKFALFILSTFPMIYAIFYLYIIDSSTIGVLRNIIGILNYVFLIFSAFVLLYYTLETISLWYAYNKRITTANLEQCCVEKKMHIYVMIPCMNEDLVIYNTVKSVLNNNYPNLHINVIDDASEDNTAEEVLKIKDKRCNLMKRVKPNAQEGKGEALNWAFYQLIDEIDKKGIDHDDVLITIIDADTDVDSDYFDKVNYVFNARRSVTGLQSKVRVIDLERDSAQDLEFAEIINSSQSLRNLTKTVAFGGNGQFCKLSTLMQLEEKPWSNSLVEDFDLSTRLYLKLGEQVQNIQVDDIFIRQTGIKKDPAALVKQRVRWAQGNVQSAKYLKPVLKSKLLERSQKIELTSTLIKPWLMAIEYMILIYTIVLISDIVLVSGINRAIAIIVVLFFIMALYILFINFVWAILYNKENKERIKIKNIVSDVYSLTKFLIVLTQIYPQSIIRFWKSENGWDKTKRQV